MENTTTNNNIHSFRHGIDWSKRDGEAQVEKKKNTEKKKKKINGRTFVRRLIKCKREGTHLFVRYIFLLMMKIQMIVFLCLIKFISF